MRRGRARAAETPFPAPEVTFPEYQAAFVAQVDELAGLPPSYLGDAVGRFEDDVLVVETIDFTDETWLTDNGAFHTTDLRVVERLRRVGNTIEYEAVAHDPAVLAAPWQARVQTLWLTDQEIEEPVPCEERDLDDMMDGSYHENPR